MASDPDFVEYVVAQIAIDYRVTYKKMFGEYALYANNKVVALICDNQLFVKPTTAGKEYMGNFVEASAYRGAKPSLLIDERMEDSEWLSKLIAVTEHELPAPKPKKLNSKNKPPKYVGSE